VRVGKFVEGDLGSLFRVTHFDVKVWPNGAEVWSDRNGNIHKVVYNTGDVVYFDEDGLVKAVTTHDGWVFASTR
jgi:hypothetical protein